MFWPSKGQGPPYPLFFRDGALEESKLFQKCSEGIYNNLNNKRYMWRRQDEHFLQFEMGPILGGIANK